MRLNNVLFVFYIGILFAKVEIVKTTHESKGAKDPLRLQAGLPEYFCIRLVVNFRWPPVEVASPFFSSPQHAP